MGKRGTLRVATCQFSIRSSIRRNAAQIRRQIRQAKRRRAQVVHFPECALCGYPGTDIEGWDGFDWDTLRAETLSICSLAREAELWVILGSAHPLTGKHLPHNSLYIINSKGRIVDRYDKRFCTGADLKHFSPGNHFPVFTINGVRCGALICYDLRFPELYRAYKKLGVHCIFQSFHNARTAKGPNIWTVIMRTTMQTRAATNYFWASVNNSSSYYQSWPSVFIRPNGEIAASLSFHRAGITVNTVDTHREFYDPSRPFRESAMRGTLHSGRLVGDPRSRDRTSL